MTDLNSYDWKIHVDPTRDWPVRCVRVFVHRRASGRLEVLNGDGTLSIHDPLVELPSDLGIVFPLEAWEALGEYAAGQSHLGAENRVLREWLTVERDRTDRRLSDQASG